MTNDEGEDDMSDHATAADVDELARLDKLATPGPWHVHEVDHHEDGVHSRGVAGPDGRGINRGEDVELFGEADADLIVAARNALPVVLARMAAADALAAAVVAMGEAMHGSLTHRRAEETAYAALAAYRAAERSATG